MKSRLENASNPENKRHSISWHIFTLSALAVVLLLEFRYMSAARFLSDESFNFRQITRFLNGDFSMEPGMNVIPGYQALVALVLFVFHKTGLFSARLVSTLLSLASILIFYLLTRKLFPRPSLEKTLQYAFFPLLFPFFSLVYTDILALLLVLLAFYLVLCERYSLGGLVAILSVLARTNNISWLAFLCFYVYTQNYGLDWRMIPRSLPKTWIYGLGFVLFAGFLFVNKGIAITAKDVQPLFKFQPGNIYFLLFMAAFLFLPLNLANLPRISALIRGRRWILLALLGFYGVYMLTFQSSHPFNQSLPDYYLRNRLLMTVTASAAWKSIFFIPVAFALLSLCVTKLRQKSFYWLYPFTILSLIPFWLIEPRYSFVPLSLFILFKEERSRLVEAATIVIYVALSVSLIVLMRSERMFI